MRTPDGEPIEIDLSGAKRASDALRRVQASIGPVELEKLGSRFAEISRRAAESLGSWSHADSDRFVRVPHLEMPELQLPVDRAGQNSERLVEIASAQQELLGRFVAEQEEASKVEARRHNQMVAIAVLCTLLGAALGAVLSAVLG